MERNVNNQRAEPEPLDESCPQGWIPTEYIASFSNYKYKSPHKTYCEGVIMEKFWEWWINFVPRCIAPNLITFAGLVVVFVGVIPMIMEDSTITQQVSTWIYIYLAIAIFVYQLLDNLDGKQARRTGTSSVLGELFDHGCDAVTWALLTIIYCYLFSYGASFGSWVAVLFQLGIFTLFTFEKRFTYELRTGIGEMGTVEAHFMYMAVLFLRAFIGPKFATADIEFLTSIFKFQFNMRNIATIIGIFTIFNGIGVTLYTAYKAIGDSNDKKYFFRYVSYIMIIFIITVCLIPFLSSFGSNPILWMTVIFCSLIKLCWKFIITSILKFHFNVYTWDQIVPLIGFPLCFIVERYVSENDNLTSALSSLFVNIMGYTLIVHILLFAYGTVYQIAGHLKINVFTITPNYNKVTLQRV